MRLGTLLLIPSDRLIVDINTEQLFVLLQSVSLVCFVISCFRRFLLIIFSLLTLLSTLMIETFSFFCVLIEISYRPISDMSVNIHHLYLYINFSSSVFFLFVGVLQYGHIWDRLKYTVDL